MVTLLLLTIVACKKGGTVSIPTTLSVSPAIDTIGGTIIITGIGFSSIPSQDTVSFNDSVRAVVLSATSTQLTVVVPAFSAKDRITVNCNGVKTQTAEIFQTVPKFSPQTEAPGYPINISVGGGTTQSDYSVSFNGTKATITSSFNNVLTVNVPTGATSGKITVLYKGDPYISLTDFTVAPVGTVSNVTAPNSFTSPFGLAFDKNSNLFVADLQGGVIDKVNTTTGVVSLYAGNASYSTAGGSPLTSAGIYGAANIQFAPNGALYATDIWYGQFWKITADSATFSYPFGYNLSTTALYIDNASNFYITENLQIKKIAANGTVSTLAGTGLQGAVDGAAASASFISPSSLAMDAAGNIYAADASKIRMLSNGVVSTFAGGYQNYKDGIGQLAGFTNVNSIVIDPATNNMFASDALAHVVRMITPLGVVTTIAGNPGQQGNQNGTGPTATFQGPTGIALDKSGNIYVSDGNFTNTSIRKIQLH